MNNSLHALPPSKLPCKCSYYSLYASAADYIANGVRFYLDINFKKNSTSDFLSTFTFAYTFAYILDLLD